MAVDISKKEVTTKRGEHANTERGVAVIIFLGWAATVMLQNSGQDLTTVLEPSPTSLTERKKGDL